MRNATTSETSSATTTAAVDSVLDTIAVKAAPAAVKAVSKASGKAGDQGRAGSKSYRIEEVVSRHPAGFTYDGDVLPRLPNPAWKDGDKRRAGHEPFLRHRDDAGLSGWDVFVLVCVCPAHAATPAQLRLTRGAAKAWVGVTIPASHIGPVL